MTKSRNGFEGWVISTALHMLGIIFALLVTNTCLADCERGAVTDAMVFMDRDNAEGIWLPTEQFTCLLSAAEELAMYQRTVALLTERATQTTAQIAALEAASAEGTALIERLELSLESATVRSVELENELDVWYRSAVVWGAIGLAVGIGATVALVFALGGS